MIESSMIEFFNVNSEVSEEELIVKVWDFDKSQNFNRLKALQKLLIKFECWEL